VRSSPSRSIRSRKPVTPSAADHPESCRRPPSPARRGEAGSAQLKHESVPKGFAWESRPPARSRSSFPTYVTLTPVDDDGRPRPRIRGRVGFARLRRRRLRAFVIQGTAFFLRQRCASPFAARPSSPDLSEVQPREHGLQVHRRFSGPRLQAAGRQLPTSRRPSPGRPAAAVGSLLRRSPRHRPTTTAGAIGRMKRQEKPRRAPRIAAHSSAEDLILLVLGWFLLVTRRSARTAEEQRSGDAGRRSCQIEQVKFGGHEGERAGRPARSSRRSARPYPLQALSKADCR